VDPATAQGRKILRGADPVKDKAHSVSQLISGIGQSQLNTELFSVYTE